MASESAGDNGTGGRGDGDGGDEAGAPVVHYAPDHGYGHQPVCSFNIST